MKYADLKVGDIVAVSYCGNYHIPALPGKVLAVTAAGTVTVRCGGAQFSVRANSRKHRLHLPTHADRMRWWRQQVDSAIYSAAKDDRHRVALLPWLREAGLAVPDMPQEVAP